MVSPYLSRLARISPRKVVRRLSDAFQDLRCTGSIRFMLGLLSGSQYSGHDIMKHLFQQVNVREDDVLVDVGCGLGRVIAFLAKHYPHNRIIGIERSDTAFFAQRIFANNPKVDIRHAPLETAFPKEATIFYIFPPGGENLLRVLKNIIDETATGNVTILTHGSSIGDVKDFEADMSWNVQMLSPPRGALRRFNNTYFIYGGPNNRDWFYGVVLSKRHRGREFGGPRCEERS